MKKIFAFFLLTNLIEAESVYHDSEYYYVYKKDIESFTQQAHSLGLSNISCEISHCFAIKDGYIWGVGRNDSGQLGLNDTTNRTTWTNTNFQADYIVVGGSWYALALKDNILYVVGANDYGQLGLGDNKRRMTWTSTGITATSIAAGAGHSYAVINGEIWSTGYNSFGQLGLGDTENRNTWTNTKVSADKVYKTWTNYGYASKNGVIYSVGLNSSGLLATGNTKHQLFWHNTEFSADYVFGDRRSGYALKNGQLYTVGDFSNYNWVNTNLTPSLISVAGDTLYMKIGSKLYVKGTNSSGNLGLGDYNPRTELTEVPEP